MTNKDIEKERILQRLLTFFKNHKDQWFTATDIRKHFNFAKEYNGWPIFSLLDKLRQRNKLIKGPHGTGFKYKKAS